MALVRISRQLISDVENGINQLSGKVFSTTIQPLCPESSGEVREGPIVAAANRALWGEHFNLVDLIPSKWKQSVDYCNCYIKQSREQNATLFSIRAYNGTKSFSAPPGSGRWGQDVNLYVTDVPEFTDLAERYAKFNAAKDEHSKKFDALRKQVVGFLNASKSLNDAIKKFPDIKLYVPQHYLMDVERVVVRAPRAVREKQEAEAAVAEMDTNLITSMGVYKAITASV